MIIEDAELLARLGWDIECESPLELRHRETGSFATKIAALLVIQGLKNQEAEENQVALPTEGEPRARELAELIQRALDWVEAARKCNSDDAWKDAFDLIFSPNCSQRIASARTELGLSFDYYDPDGSYEDDVTAYVEALKDWAHKKVPFFPEFAVIK